MLANPFAFVISHFETGLLLYLCHMLAVQFLRRLRAAELRTWTETPQIQRPSNAPVSTCETTGMLRCNSVAQTTVRRCPEPRWNAGARAFTSPRRWLIDEAELNFSLTHLPDHVLAPMHLRQSRSAPATCVPTARMAPVPARPDSSKCSKSFKKLSRQRSSRGGLLLLELIQRRSHILPPSCSSFSCRGGSGSSGAIVGSAFLAAGKAGSQDFQLQT